MKKMRSSLFLRSLSLALALPLGVSCTKAANDSQVASDIQSRLAADSALQNKQIAVQSDKGSVPLSGTAQNDAQRDAAAKDAAAAPGLKHVSNNLQGAPI